MTRKVVLILLFVCSFVFLGTTRQGSAVGENVGAAGASQQTTLTSEQVQSLKDDLNKMRSLVQQMETNLNFVDTTQSPLKHQFQLEIDMWKLTIQRMDRQLQGGR